MPSNRWKARHRNVAAPSAVSRLDSTRGYAANPLAPPLRVFRQAHSPGPLLTDLTDTHRRRLAVVSYLAHHPYTPRGVRTRHIVQAARGRWDVRVIAGPRDLTHPSLPVRAFRHARYRLLDPVALDSYEAWARRRLGFWRPKADLALLVGYPWSPVYLASRRLAAAGIPYVVDASDPWAATLPGGGERSVVLRRGRRAEEAVFGDARGAIVTTQGQRDVLQRLFPDLEVVVRPNGYTQAEPAPSTHTISRSPGRRELHMGHFGSLYAPRIDFVPFFEQLSRGPWDVVVFHQFGEDSNQSLARMPSQIDVRVHEALPWGEVITIAEQLDAAFVLGNTNPTQLPSKTVDYLTLPIPRIALVRDPSDDSIARYVADKAGWLVLAASDDRVADHVAAHLREKPDPAALAPPPDESWQAVGHEIVAYLQTVAEAQ